MRGDKEITNSDDIIDGRELQRRIDYLEAERESLAESLEEARESLREETDKLREVGHEPDLTELQEAVTNWSDSLAEWDASDEAKELKTLQAIASNVDTRDATLIRADHFPQYAQQQAEELNPRDALARWPFTCIDWDQAAHELQGDYSSLDFDGVTYYVRD